VLQNIPFVKQMCSAANRLCVAKVGQIVSLSVRNSCQTIAFAAQFGLGAIEIERVNSFDLLATELGMASLTIANALPKQVLGGRH
jgi:hypothetical protein